MVGRELERRPGTGRYRSGDGGRQRAGTRISRVRASRPVLGPGLQHGRSACPASLWMSPERARPRHGAAGRSSERFLLQVRLSETLGGRNQTPAPRQTLTAYETRRTGLLDCPGYGTESAFSDRRHALVLTFRFVGSTQHRSGNWFGSSACRSRQYWSPIVARSPCRLLRNVSPAGALRTGPRVFGRRRARATRHRGRQGRVGCGRRQPRVYLDRFQRLLDATRAATAGRSTPATACAGNADFARALH